MRRLLAIALAAACAGACAGRREPVSDEPAGIALPAPGAGRPQHLVLATVHGLTADHYLDAVPAMPTLAALARAGVAAERVIPVFPASTYPGHATLVTGGAPAEHGVAADHRLSDAGIESAWLDRADDLRAATLWQAAAPRAAALDWPSTGGAAVGDLAPDLALPPGASWVEAVARAGAGRAAALAQRAGGSDARTAQPGAARDAALVTMTCALLVGESPPSLVLLRLSQTAVALERVAPGSEAAHASFAAVDAELARLVRCLGDAGLLATTAIAVAGDHGAVPVHTEIRANVALADAGLLVAEPTGAVRRWDAIARPSGGSAFVYARRDEDALLARSALSELANEAGAFRVLSAQEMVERGADPEAWFGLEAEPGFVFGAAAAGSRLAPASTASAGGYGGGEPRVATGFVAWGPGLRAGLRVPSMRQVDVAPTLALWLGLRLDAARGRPLVGILRGGAP